MTTRYHINPETGRPNKCRAKTPAGCKFTPKDGEPPPHYATEEEARKAYEQEQASQGRTTTTLSKKAAPQAGVQLKTYGIGRERKLKDAGGMRWDPSYTVTACLAAGHPPHKNVDDFEPYTDAEEIKVNGEVVGYIMQNAHSYYPFTTKTLEEMNDPQSIACFQDAKRLDAVSTLIKRWQQGKRGVSEEFEQKFLADKWNRVNPEVVEVSPNEKLFIETKEHSVGSRTRQVFLVENGKPVCYIQMREGVDFWDKPYAQRLSVETRYSDRGKGYAKRLSHLLEERYSVPLASSGEFTELGFKAFGKNTVRVGEEASSTWGPTVPAMNFIMDWDALRPRYQLR